jgi:hypothetical protein
LIITSYHLICHRSPETEKAATFRLGGLRDGVQYETMILGYRIRPLLAVALLAAFVVCMVFLQFTAVSDRHRKFEEARGRDQVAIVQERMAPLAAFLSPFETVGYATDLAEHNAKKAKWVMSQYALAPAILLEGWEWPLVVGDFYSSLPAGRIPSGYVPVRDTGRGVFLLGKAKR